MKVVQIAPYSAYPPQSGAQNRIHGLMLGRGEDDTVTRFATVELGNKTGTVNIASDYTEIRFSSLVTSGIGFLGSFFDAGQVFASSGLRIARPARLDGLISDADVLVVETPWQIPYIDSIRPAGTPLVYSSHNFECEEYNFLGERLWSRPIYRSVQRIEQRALELSDLIVVTSERDKHLYKKRFNVSGQFYIAVNGAMIERDEVTDDCSSPSNDLSGKRHWTAIFVGSSHKPNVRAVEQILKLAKDRRIRTCPIEFQIVGSVCGSFRDESSPENVELIGFVDDLNPYYRQADIALNPITTGGGTNVKVPEYFAHGLTVISTEYGMRGVPAEPGKHYVICELGNFVEVIIKLLNDGGDRILTIGREAEALTKNQLNWRSVSTEYFEVLRSL